MTLQHRIFFREGANGSLARSITPHTEGTSGSCVVLQKSMRLEVVNPTCQTIACNTCKLFSSYLLDASLTGIRGISNCCCKRWLYSRIRFNFDSDKWCWWVRLPPFMVQLTKIKRERERKREIPCWHAKTHAHTIHSLPPHIVYTQKGYFPRITFLFLLHVTNILHSSFSDGFCGNQDATQSQ